MLRTCTLAALAAAVLAAIALAALALAADPPAPSPPPRGILPRDFKKLGLTDDQKKQVLSITGSYREKISALEQQLADLKAAEHKEVIAVLTPDQVKQLDALLTGDKPDATPPPPKDKP